MKFIIVLILLTLNFLYAKSIALLIANSKYQYLDRLNSPQKDIPDLAKKLKKLGFEVIVKYDLDEKEMKKTIKWFKKKLQKNPNSIALFYYSGHGSQAYGESYLIPIDGDTRDEADVEADGVKVETIAQNMAHASTKVNLLFLDACRDIPTGTMGGTKGLGQVKRQPSSTVIIYSTSKNHTARDDRVFNKTVLTKLSTSEPISVLVNNISYEVSQKTGGSQIPEILSSGLPNICLTGRCDKIRHQSQSNSVTSISKNIEWITPKDNICKANGGNIDKYGCYAEWKEAKEICKASRNGELPTIEELKKAIINCRGKLSKDNYQEGQDNKNNIQYQRCYKKMGFKPKNYWSSTKESVIGNKIIPWQIDFNYGEQTVCIDKCDRRYVRCVRVEQNVIEGMFD